MKALGRHLLLELCNCDPKAIGNIETVKAAMIEAARRAQATIVSASFHDFNSPGIFGVVIIGESHLSIYTWPEHRYAAVDIFTCSETMRPEVAASCLVEQLGAERTVVIEMARGLFLNTPATLQHKVASSVH